jgi:neutral ceramidase
MNRRAFLQHTTAWAPFAQLGFPQTAALLKAGFAERDITPDIGMEQPGGYGKSYHRSFHDPCKVRAAVFDDGATRVALVGIDALSVPRSLVLAARKQILEQHGIAQHAVLIGASHSHSSGPTDWVQPHQFDSASPLIRKLAYEHSPCADAGYLERVRAEIVTAVGLAYRARVEARCSAGFGVESGVAYNRRIRMRNGLSYSHPGKGNPDNIDYAGPTDPQVGVIGAWDKDGRLLGSIVNYSCHATTSPGGISANWIYYLEKTIRGGMDANVPIVFLQGPCGDVTQVDNLSLAANPTGEEWARLVGGRVGAEAVKVLLSAPRGSLAPLDARNRVLEIKRRVPDPERVRRCYQIVQKDAKEVGATEWTFAKEIVLLDALIAAQPLVPVEVQAVQVGPVILLTNPAELFVAFGLDLKKRSPFPFTFPVELANGSVGYVPTEEAFGPHGGGYETRLTSYSNLETTAGRRMVETALALAAEMKPGKSPEFAKAPPFKDPWSYGNVPPEVR